MELLGKEFRSFGRIVGDARCSQLLNFIKFYGKASNFRMFHVFWTSIQMLLKLLNSYILTTSEKIQTF